MDPLQTDQHFFDLLLKGDGPGLEKLLSDDFLLIDVFTGSEVSKAALSDVLRSGALAFHAIDVKARRARTFPEAAIVTGETEMSGSMGGSPWSVKSRYSHVYVREGSGWRMASAQGTPIKA